ncbi:sensor histidine kinase, partial [Micromonospora aurantiaca]|nr:sensor histidine kinase [Micromonospora aurantiaca]
AIEATSRETLSGLRRMLTALRKDGADSVPLGPTPGLDDLASLAGAAADAGVEIDISTEGERRPLPPDVDLSAYRIVQEAVTNVVRHAGTDRCR